MKAKPNQSSVFNEPHFYTNGCGHKDSERAINKPRLNTLVHDWELMLKDAQELVKAVIDYRDHHQDDEQDCKALQYEIVELCNHITRNAFGLVFEQSRNFITR